MKMVAGFLAFISVVALAASPALARGNHHNTKTAAGYCASGKHVDDMKLCKENGGKK